MPQGEQLIRIPLPKFQDIPGILKRFAANNYKPFLLSLLSAAIIVLSFPTANLHFLIWVFLIPILYMLYEKGPSRSLAYGLLAGFLANIGILYWIFNSVLAHSNSFIGAVVALCALSMYIALYTIGIWAFTLGVVGTSLPSFFLPIFASSLWVTMEYLRTHAFTGFPWALLGYSQWNILPLIQISEYTGVYGVSFLIVYFNVSLFQFLKSRRWVPLVTSLVLIGAAVATGNTLLKRNSVNAAPVLKTAVLQGNIDQYKKWDIVYEKEILDKFTALALTAAKQKPDLIVWPETAVPGYLPEDEHLSVWIRTLARETSTYHLIGAPYHDPKESDRFFNATFLIDPNGDVIGYHKKIHLVAFGEFMPFRNFFSIFGFDLLNTLGDFTPGHKPTVLTVKSVKIGPSICSENFYGSIMRGFPEKGAEILFNQTNDAWFFATSAPHQHFTMNVFRCIETRRQMLICGNTGISGIIEPTGKIGQTIPLFTTNYALYNLSPNSKITFYTRYGDVFSGLCSLITIVTLGIWFSVYIREKRYVKILNRLQKIQQKIKDLK